MEQTKIIMTDMNPLLTVENVKYWYWECDPAYSTLDIAKVTGTYVKKVQNFMQKHNIPRRSLSEANLNRFKCAHKKKSFIKQMNLPEYKLTQSEKSLAVWKDQSKRKKLGNSIKEYHQTHIGELQALILFVIRRHTSLFLTEMVKLLNKDKRSLDTNLKSLYKRGFVSRQKQLNHNTRNSYASHYYYSLTNKGINLLDQKTKDPKLISLFNSVDDSNLKQNKNSISTYLGKNQKEILRWFQNNNSLFLTDLKKLTSIEKSILDKSLNGLFKRGFLSRKKEINPNSLNHLMHFRYRLTEVGNKIQIE